MRVRRTGGHTAASALRVPLRAEALRTSGPSRGGSRGPRPGQPLGLGPADRVIGRRTFLFPLGTRFTALVYFSGTFPFSQK